MPSDPTKFSLNLLAFGLYGPAAATEMNISAYTDPSTTSYQLIQETMAEDLAIRNNDNCTIIGEYLQLLETTFSTSKAAGKPWQIYASSVMMGHYVLPDPSLWYLDAPSKEIGLTYVKSFVDTILNLPDEGLTLRVVSLLAQINLEWNLDDFSACHSERAKIMEIAKNAANNMVRGHLRVLIHAHISLILVRSCDYFVDYFGWRFARQFWLGRGGRRSSGRRTRGCESRNTGYYVSWIRTHY